MNFTGFILSPIIKKNISVAIVSSAIQFIIFKLLYPNACFTPDSHNYIYAASVNLNINVLPIGYSKFLMLVHKLTNSDSAIVFLQYLAFFISALYFFLSIIYFFEPGKYYKLALLIFLFFNPIFLFLSNTINNDCIFLSVSILWLTNLFWIVNNSTISRLFIQGILLFICISVSGKAFYYFFISAFVIILSNQSIWKKITGIGLFIVTIVTFTLYSIKQIYKTTGTHQFSLSVGWQLANNALYTYEFADSSNFTSNQARTLDRYVRRFYSQISPDFIKSRLTFEADDYFIRASYAPLKVYMSSQYKPNNPRDYVVAWAKSSITFSEYGGHIIKHNLPAYLWEFVLPNTRKYFMPPLQKPLVYSGNTSEIDPLIKQWFNFKNSKISTIPKNVQEAAFFIFPSIFFLINIYAISLIIWVFLNKKISESLKTARKRILTTLFILYISSFLYYTLTIVISFRNQVFPMIVCFTLVLLLIERLSLSSINKNSLRKIKLNSDSNCSLDQLSHVIH